MLRKIFFLALLISTLYSDAHIFVYHRFGDARHASTNVSLNELRKQFDYFKKHNYKIISQKRLTQAFANGEKIPDNWVILNIDDSYKSFYQNGLALFKEYHYPFTLYVYIQATNGHYGDFMTWEMIKESSKYGEIALHSNGHPHMVSMSTQAVYKDTKKAYDSFVEHMGFKPKAYAYPYGEYSPSVRAEIEKFNFDLIMNQNAGAINESSDKHDLDRMALTGTPNLKVKLRTKVLQTTWKAPIVYPPNGVLKNIQAIIPPSIKKVEYYISGNKWRVAQVNKGVVNIESNIKLTKTRTRIFLKHGNAQSSIILVKGKN